MDVPTPRDALLTTYFNTMLTYAGPDNIPLPLISVPDRVLPPFLRRSFPCCALRTP